MMSSNRFARSITTFTACCAISVLAGCGGGGSGGTPSSPATGANNTPPSIQGRPGSTVAPAQAYNFEPAAADADGGTLTFSAENLPAWMRIDRSSGRLTGTPTTGDIGTYAGITITVSDGRASATLGPFSVTVTDAGMGTATLSWLPPTQNSDGTP